MKAWITTQKLPFEASDYLVLSPSNGQSPYDIDNYLDDNECDNLVLDEVLEYIPYSNIEKYLSKVISKLRHKGELVINGTDINEVNKAYFHGLIDTFTFNSHIYGHHTGAWDFKQSGLSIYEVVEILKKNGLKIIHKRLPNLKYSIVAERT